MADRLLLALFLRLPAPPKVWAWRAPCVLLLAASTWLAVWADAAQAQGGRPPAAPVSVSPVVQRTVADTEEFSGRIEATEFVELRARVAGTLDKVHFADGAMVSRGQLLFSIDARSFEAEVARLESVLVAARARAELAGAELARVRTLLASNAVSRQEVDQLGANAKTADADIRTTEAQLRNARLGVEHASVRAPIAGRASRAAVTAGNLVNEQLVLTSIANMGKVHAYFDGSEQTYLRIKAATGRSPVVRMGLANETGHPHEGKLDFIDNRLNPQTGSIRMRAVFDNKQGLFTPGLAARVMLSTSGDYTALLVPERAIGTDQTRKVVVVVGSDGQPQFRVVQLGPLLGGMRVVSGGAVKLGENVIVDGLQRVIPGLPVAATVLQTDAQGMPVFPPPAAPKR